MLETAYRQQLPIRVIVVDGKRRGATDPNPKASQVESRLLDPISWAVTQFDEATGRCVLVRGIRPELPASASPDAELSWFEGKQRGAFILHRQREEKARRTKIAEAKSRHGGRLICEVPGCGFEFFRKYGALGEGYVQVHHLAPLNIAAKSGRETKLEDLAVVCANCHVMIHKGGHCRELAGLIPSR
jgi:5-methylcytosine-specific restriction protein A